MRAKTSLTLLMLATVFSLVSCATGKSGRTGDQAATQHDMHQPPAAAQHEHDHAGHKMGPAVMDGSWSYLGRTNPKPFTDKRWEMVPVPGYGHMYVNSGNLSRELICESLQDNPSIMVDRATRKDCSMPEIPPVAAAGRAIAAGEPEMKGTAQHEHWSAPEEAAKRPNPIPTDPTSIERGRALFQTHCAVCHGPKGLGDGPASSALTPRPDNLAVMAGQHPAGDLAWKIEKGRGAMPPWKGILTGPQIWDLVNFLKDLKKPESKSEPPSHRHDRPGHAH